MPGRGAVRPEKQARVAALSRAVLEAPVTALVGVRGVPGAALQSMRRELRSRGHPIVVATNSAIRHALETAGAERPALRELMAAVDDQTAVLAADGNPFALFQEFLRTRSPTPARGGEIAPHDIFVPAGSTSFKPGPIVGELQQAGFAAAIEKGKVVLKKDTTIVRAGQPIPRAVATILTRLDIKPLEVGLTVRGVVQGSTYYPGSALNVDLDGMRADLGRAARRALGLAVELAYVTPTTLEPIAARAHRRALGLAIAVGYPTPETLEPLFGKAMREAAAVARITGT